MRSNDWTIFIPLNIFIAGHASTLDVLEQVEIIKIQTKKKQKREN
jgi:hypothetical protein